MSDINDLYSVKQTVSAGEILRKRREGLGLSLEEVSHQLRIRLSFLKALEDGKLDELPGLAYASGFLRAYAEFLGVNADNIIQQFRCEHHDIENKQKLMFPAPVPQSGMPAAVIVFFGIVIIIGGYIGWYKMTDHDTPPKETVPSINATLDHSNNGDNKSQRDNGQLSPQIASVLPAQEPTDSANKPDVTDAVQSVEKQVADGQTPEQKQNEDDSYVIRVPVGGKSDNQNNGQDNIQNQNNEQANQNNKQVDLTENLPKPLYKSDAEEQDTASPSKVNDSVNAPNVKVIDDKAIDSQATVDNQTINDKDKSDKDKSIDNEAIDHQTTDNKVIDDKTLQDEKLETASDTAGTENTGDENSESELSIKTLGEESWVKVVDENDNILVQKTLPPDTSWVFPKGKSMLILTVGNAGNVVLVRDGKISRPLTKKGKIVRNLILTPETIDRLMTRKKAVGKKPKEQVKSSAMDTDNITDDTNKNTQQDKDSQVDQPDQSMIQDQQGGNAQE